MPRDMVSGFMGDSRLEDYLSEYGYRTPAPFLPIEQYAPQRGATPAMGAIGGAATGLANIVQALLHRKRDNKNTEALGKAKERISQEDVAAIKSQVDKFRSLGLDKLATVVETLGVPATSGEFLSAMTEKENNATKERESWTKSQAEQAKQQEKDAPIQQPQAFDPSSIKMPYDNVSKLSKDFGMPTGPQSLAPEAIQSTIKQSNADIGSADTQVSPVEVASQWKNQDFTGNLLDTVTKIHSKKLQDADNQKITSGKDTLAEKQARIIYSKYDSYTKLYDIAAQKAEKAYDVWAENRLIEKSVTDPTLRKSMHLDDPEPKFDQVKLPIEDWIRDNSVRTKLKLIANEGLKAVEEELGQQNDDSFVGSLSDPNANPFPNGVPQNLGVVSSKGKPLYQPATGMSEQVTEEEVASKLKSAGVTNPNVAKILRDYPYLDPDKLRALGVY